MRRVDKLAALCRILDVEDPTSALVFARTRGEVDDLAEALSSRGHDAGALHGGLAQEARDRIMGRFRDGALDVLVATDVAARGLDIEHVSHVVNYDVPSDPDAYVHRIGRTGRAGREGVAITLVEPREHRLLRNIESATKSKLQIARLPTVADLRERRLELLRANLRDALETGGHDRFRGVVEPLTEEFDVVDIALAAVSLIEGAETPRRGRGRARPGVPAAAGPARAAARAAGGPRRATYRRSPGGADRRRAAPGSSGRPRRRGPGQADRAAAAARRSRPARPEADGWEQLWIGGGRRAGLRPGDLVGAIANEAGVPGSVVGAIQLFDDFALVDVQGQVADAVEHALRNATIRGQRLPVRRERATVPPLSPRRAAAELSAVGRQRPSSWSTGAKSSVRTRASPMNAATSAGSARMPVAAASPQVSMRAVTAATSSGAALATSTTFPPPYPPGSSPADDRHVLEQPPRGRRLGPDEARAAGSR